jgi:hypothetical protein
LRRGKQSQLKTGTLLPHAWFADLVTGARNVPIFFSPFEKTKPIQGAVGRGFERLAARKTEPIEAKNHVCAWA